MMSQAFMVTVMAVRSLLSWSTWGGHLTQAWDIRGL